MNRRKIYVNAGRMSRKIKVKMQYEQSKINHPSLPEVPDQSERNNIACHCEQTVDGQAEENGYAADKEVRMAMPFPQELIAGAVE